MPVKNPSWGHMGISTGRPHHKSTLSPSVSGLPEGYIAHRDLDGAITVSTPDGFLWVQGKRKVFFSEQEMISYCQRHAEAGLKSDQEVRL